MRENHNTQSCEYRTIYHDELHIASTTHEEIPHTSKDKCKINILQGSNYLHDPGGRNICQLKEYLEKLYEM